MLSCQERGTEGQSAVHLLTLTSVNALGYLRNSLQHFQLLHEQNNLSSNRPVLITVRIHYTETAFKLHEKTKCQKLLLKQVSLLSSAHSHACAASGRVLPTTLFSQPHHFALHFALLPYKHLQQQSPQDFTKGF